MSDAPLTIPLRVPVGKSVLSGLLFIAAGAFFLWLAANGIVDVGMLRKLPLEAGGKVVVLRILAGLSIALGGLGLTKVLALVRPPILVIGDTHADVPHGIGLLRRTRVSRADLQPARVTDYGAGQVLALSWTGGKAYLPLAWFPSPDHVETARSALQTGPS